jgi:hypothetical protein
VPESHIYGILEGPTEDTVTYGIADAIAVDGSGVKLIIDWKSDVSPTEQTVAAYKQQIGEYLTAVGVHDGLIVFPTTGKVIRIRI